MYSMIEKVGEKGKGYLLNGWTPLLLTNILIPHLRLVVDKSLHQCFTPLVLKHHDFNASLLQVLFTSHKSLVLTDYNPGYLVHHTCTSTHVTRRQCCVHGGTSVC